MIIKKLDRPIYGVAKVKMVFNKENPSEVDEFHHDLNSIFFTDIDVAFWWAKACAKKYGGKVSHYISKLKKYVIIDGLKTEDGRTLKVVFKIEELPIYENLEED